MGYMAWFSFEAKQLKTFKVPLTRAQDAPNVGPIGGDEGRYAAAMPVTPNSPSPISFQCVTSAVTLDAGDIGIELADALCGPLAFNQLIGLLIHFRAAGGGALFRLLVAQRCARIAVLNVAPDLGDVPLHILRGLQQSADHHLQNSSFPMSALSLPCYD
ncbi:hypothetical protein [Mesorhizobium japonicum]|uniref:hypothetical protein n=1 Tax=Mesorhizobium TaxID=68287 RepID=UPI001FCEA039|nr:MULTISPECIES: hypothetical protein [Mesorhizobium]